MSVHCAGSKRREGHAAVKFYFHSPVKFYFHSPVKLYFQSPAALSRGSATPPRHSPAAAPLPRATLRGKVLAIPRMGGAQCSRKFAQLQGQQKANANSK